MLRTAEVVGSSGLILVGDAVDPYDPATARSTMGSLFSQQFVRTSLTEFAQWRQRQLLRLIGTAPAAGVDYQAADYAGPTVLLLGDERKGLSPGLQTLGDTMARIPMVGEAASLNLSVAASLMLYGGLQPTAANPCDEHGRGAPGTPAGRFPAHSRVGILQDCTVPPGSRT